MADRPAEKPTVQIPTVSPVEIAIAKLTVIVEDRFREMGTTVALVTTDLGVLKSRVSVIESLRSEDESRLTKASTGVRGLSQSDAGQSLEIASLSVKVDELTKTQALQLDILGRLDKVASNPSVKIILAVIATAAASWAASKGLR